MTMPESAAPASLYMVTGASRGIGHALEIEARAHGFTTATVSRGNAAGTHHLSADLSNESAWERMVDWTQNLVNSEQWAKIVFVHCAATLEPIGFSGEVDSEELKRQLMLNLMSPLVLGHELVRILATAAIPSTIVMITSGASTTAYPGWSGYGPAKAAIDHWVRTVGAEQTLRGSEVSVIAVAPGVVDTEMQSMIRSTDSRQFPKVDRFVDMQLENTLASPRDVAEKLFALSVDPGAINGAVTDLRRL